ncbi:MAG: MarR family transcriptional regulator [Spirochaetes bacterium]|nr:MarR family transcriptional regulator [Spirochaetota bacterium]
MGKDIFFILHSIFKKMRKIADKQLHVYGMTHTEMRILNMIYILEADGDTQDEFAKRIEIDRTNVGRSLKKLENLGYIRREKAAEDKRALRVFITEKGLVIKDEILAVRENIKNIFTKDMTQTEINSLTELLEKSDKNLN